MTTTTTTREHDLPPRWDGHPVTWEAWSTEVPTTLRLHVDDGGACDRCGSLELARTTQGVVTAPDEPPHRLYLSRCADCAHDTVVDHDGVVWELDPSDYTDQGSTPPAEAPAPAPPARPRPTGRPLPADSSTCERCGEDIVWAITVAGPNGRGGKRQPFDPHEHPDGNVAILSPRRGRLLARALMGDEQHDPPNEYLGMPHAATCQPTRGTR